MPPIPHLRRFFAVVLCFCVTLHGKDEALMSQDASRSIQPSLPDPELAGFQSPPAEARPLTWWRFMDDLITREGMVAGPYPPLLTRTQPWAELASPWVDYLSRSCHLLQQGTFAADLVTVFRVGQRGFEPPAGYAADLCNEELIVSSMTWDGTSLCLPSGMRYRLLELPDTTKDLSTFTPADLPAELRTQPVPQRLSLPLLRKLRELVLAGAAIVGPRPEITPGLEGYSGADQELARIANELWGPIAERVSGPMERRVGAGRVFSGLTPGEALARLGIAPAFQTADRDRFDQVPWIHRRLGEDDLFFVSNQQDTARTLVASFRVEGKVPELWHADTGTVTPATDWDRQDGRTEVTLRLEPRGSVFVRFRNETAPIALPVRSAPTAPAATLDLSTGWNVRFKPALGGPAEPIAFPTLATWSEHPNRGIRHYSGIALYERTFAVSDEWIQSNTRATLDLGDVRNLARITLNATSFPALWKPPFVQDLRSALRSGENHLTIEVANVWANRLVGDEQEPADLRWGPERIGNNRGLRLFAGRPLEAWPEWFIKGEPRPSSGRVTFTTWNFVKPDQPLLPSGLLGPVTLSRFRE